MTIENDDLEESVSVINKGKGLLTSAPLFLYRRD